MAPIQPKPAPVPIAPKPVPPPPQEEGAAAHRDDVADAAAVPAHEGVYPDGHPSENEPVRMLQMTYEEAAPPSHPPAHPVQQHPPYQEEAAPLLDTTTDDALDHLMNAQDHFEKHSNAGSETEH